MVKCLQILSPMNPQLLQWLKDSRAIYDQALYHQRQSYFSSKEAGKIQTYNFNELYKIVKDTGQYISSTLDIPVKQYIIRQVASNWLAFIKASTEFKKNPSKFTGRPSILKYLYKKTDFNLLQFDSTRLRDIDYKDNSFCLPKFRKFRIRVPKWLDIKTIRYVSVQYFYGKIKINIVYDSAEEACQDLEYRSSIGIDIGLNNLCAITSNDRSLSYIVKGGPVKSLNQFYNKVLGGLKSDLEKFNRGQKTSKRIQKLSLKRRNKIEDYLHKASKRIIDLCVRERIGRIVIGHNKGWKQEIELGKRTNQNFVQIPFNRLIDMIRYKGEEKGICVETVEESYTSKVDHMSLEPLCRQEVYSGQRVKRGLFKSGTGKALNADINGAIGILRKANVIPDEQLLLLQDRGDVVSPKVLSV